MNDWVASWGLAGLKPLAGALLLPPVPLLVLLLMAAWLWRTPSRARPASAWRRPLGWGLFGLAIAGLWLTHTTAMSRWLTLQVLQPPPALLPTELSTLRGGPPTAIVVLGGGRRVPAAEWGDATLHPRSIERLRYGVAVARATGLPLAFSGGRGHGEPAGPSEADLAARSAEAEFRWPLRWKENLSRDTAENARLTVALLKREGIRRVVLVTHAYHMPRALRNFERAAATEGLQVLPAPTARPAPGPLRLSDWLPSHRGAEETRLALHELVGLWSGA